MGSSCAHSAILLTMPAARFALGTTGKAGSVNGRMLDPPLPPCRRHIYCWIVDHGLLPIVVVVAVMSSHNLDSTETLLVYSRRQASLFL